MNSSERLKQEFDDLNDDPISNLGLVVSLMNDDNIYIYGELAL